LNSYENWKRSAVIKCGVAIAALGSPAEAATRETTNATITMLPESSPRIYTDVSVDPFVRGFLHRPESPTGQGLVLITARDRIASPAMLAICRKGFGRSRALPRACAAIAVRQDRS